METPDILEEQSFITRQLDGEQYAMMNGNIIKTQEYFVTP
jgi:hypothetical protein